MVPGSLTDRGRDSGVRPDLFLQTPPERSPVIPEPPILNTMSDHEYSAWSARKPSLQTTWPWSLHQRDVERPGQEGSAPLQRAVQPSLRRKCIRDDHRTAP